MFLTRKVGEERREGNRREGKSNQYPQLEHRRKFHKSLQIYGVALPVSRKDRKKGLRLSQYFISFIRYVDNILACFTGADK